jgi:uncharacterized protein YkwD
LATSPAALRPRLHVEELEDRVVPSTSLAPTAEDQLFLERLNDARANPTAYGASIGVNLSGVAASQPLAWDARLVAAAQGHSQDMNDQAYFGHTSPEGSTLALRLAAVGYPYTSYSESIAAGFATPQAALQALIADVGVPSLGHRLQLLSIGAAYQGLSQVGIGIVQGGSGPYQNYFTIDTASTANTNPFLTGCIYNDANHNGVYDIGEALAGVTVAVQGGPTITDFASGGYSIQLAPGTYTVTYSGGGLPHAITETVTLGSQNVRLNITPATASAGTPPPSTPPPSTPPPSTPPAAQHNYAGWVAQLGQDLWQQPLAASQVSTWASYLQQGGSPATVVSALMSSQYYAQAQLWQWVAEIGQGLLQRAMTLSERNTWVSYLQTGGTQVGFITGLMSAAGDSSLSTANWLNTLSEGLLQRPLTSAELGAWVSYLQGGGSKQTAVATFLGSAAYQQAQDMTWLSATAQTILGRSLQPTELSAWLSYLMQGGSRSVAMQSFVSTASFTAVDLNS